MLVFVTLACFVGLSQAFVFGGPAHAQCHVDWNIGTSCDDAKAKIAAQITAWNGPSGCSDGGEKCLYALKTNTDSEITGTHETPKHHYVDDISFNFVANGDTCTVKGYSTSETWYAHLDSSTNYCNLYNLVEGAGLKTMTGYAETTSDAICTQHSTADCGTY